MGDSHCEILWSKNSVAYLGNHPALDHGAAVEDDERQALIYQQCLISKMIRLCIRYSLIIYSKRNLRA